MGVDSLSIIRIDSLTESPDDPATLGLTSIKCEQSTREFVIDNGNNDHHDYI